MQKIKTKSLFLVLFVMGAPALALAQTLPPPPQLTPQFGVVTLCNIAGWMFSFLIVFSIIGVLLAAFSYLTAFGDPEKIGVANRRIIFAAVAIAVALFAKGFPTLIGSVLGANIPLQC